MKFLYNRILEFVARASITIDALSFGANSQKTPTRLSIRFRSQQWTLKRTLLQINERDKEKKKKKKKKEEEEEERVWLMEEGKERRGGCVERSGRECRTTFQHRFNCVHSNGSRSPSRPECQTASRTLLCTNDGSIDRSNASWLPTTSLRPYSEQWQCSWRTSARAVPRVFETFPFSFESLALTAQTLDSTKRKWKNYACASSFCRRIVQKSGEIRRVRVTDD